MGSKPARKSQNTPLRRATNVCPWAKVSFSKNALQRDSTFFHRVADSQLVLFANDEPLDVSNDAWRGKKWPRRLLNYFTRISQTGFLYSNLTTPCHSCAQSDIVTRSNLPDLSIHSIRHMDNHQRFIKNKESTFLLQLIEDLDFVPSC